MKHYQYKVQNSKSLEIPVYFSDGYHIPRYITDEDVKLHSVVTLELEAPLPDQLYLCMEFRSLFFKLRVVDADTGKDIKSQNIKYKNHGETPKLEYSIDLLFMMDCTLSMKPYIVAAKNAITSICQYITTEAWNQFRQQTSIRVGFVGYRDYDDGPLRHISFPFQTYLPDKPDFPS